MTITWAYTLAYQEALLIRYWIRHYRTICDRVIVYLDTDTTDDTANIAIAAGAEVRPYQGSGHLDDVAFVKFAQDHYKEARGHADWVIWTDVDEILYHKRLAERLGELRVSGINVPKVVGYNMIANAPPTGPGQIYDEIRSGVASSAYDKPCIFDPSLDVVWSPGKHSATVLGSSNPGGDEDPLKLLHYRWLGEQYFADRSSRNYSRLDSANIARRHGFETYPGSTGMYSHSWYSEQVSLAKDCL